MKNLSDRINAIATIAGALVLSAGFLGTLLVLSGYLYFLGYISKFGISTDASPMDLSESIPYAFYISLILAVGVIKYMWWPIKILAGIFVFVTLIIGAITLAVHFNWNKGDKDKSSHTFIRLIKKILKSSIHALENAWHWVSVTTLILSTSMLILILVYNSGLNQGAKDISAFSEANFNCEKIDIQRAKCYRLNDIQTGEEIAKGLLLSGTARFVTIYNGESVQVFPRNQNMVLSVIGPKTQIQRPKLEDKKKE